MINLLKSLFMICVITIFSRILGFVRDAIIAKTFGIGIITDAFFIAFKIPNLLRRIFADGAFSQSFIPILIEYKNCQEEKVIRTFIANVAGLLILILSLIICIVLLLAPWIIIIVAPGFINIYEQFSLSVTLLRIMFPYILLISLSSLVGSIINSWNNFIVPAFTPILLNITIVICMLLTISWFNPPITVVAWSVILGGSLQLLFQLPFLYHINMLVVPSVSFNDAGVIRILKLMSISVVAISGTHISLVINSIFSSFLDSGSISWMYYADRLMEFPAGILGVSLGTILLPLLSKSAYYKNTKEYSYIMNWGLKVCLVSAVPSAVLLGYLAKPLVIVLFQYGNFSMYDVEMTQLALKGYSVGLVGLILVKVLVVAFYSSNNIKVLVRISIITLIITQLMNLAFIGSLKHVGLSLSIGLGACCNAGLLYWYLYVKRIFIPQPGWLIFFVRLFLSIVVMLLVLYILFDQIINNISDNLLNRLVLLFLIIMISIITYCCSLLLFGFRLKDFTCKVVN